MRTLRLASYASALGLIALASPTLAQGNPTTFNGFYIGGTVSADTPDDSSRDGFVFDTDRDGNYDDTVRTVAGANAFSPGFCRGDAPTATRIGSCGGNDLEFGYSARVGVDARFGDGPLVAGVVVEGARPGVKDFTTAFSTTPASYTIGREIDWSVSARGRFGISPGDGRGLLYATGGVTYGRIEQTFLTTNTANSFTANGSRDWQIGWQAGAGAEVMLAPNISLGLEYLYSQYDEDDYFVEVGRGTAPVTNPFLLASGGTNLRHSTDNLDYHSFRAGLNFRF